MGIIAKQSSWASLAIGIGVAFGAVNTMVVLPRAFEGVEAQWGLLRLLTSWGIILSSLTLLGAPSGIMRFLARYDEKERPGILRTLLILPTTGLIAVLVVVGLFGHQILPLLNAEKGESLSNHIVGFLLITSAMVLLQLVRTIINQQLKTAILSWVDQVWQKGSYLTLGILFYFKKIDFDSFLSWYIATWGISALFLLIQAYNLPQRIGKTWNRREFKKIINFSLFSLLTGGASIIAFHLDFVMIGKYIGLEQIPIYTVGLFLGALVGMPMRASRPILGGLTASFVAENKTRETHALNHQSARVNFLLSTAIMSGIWAGLSPFQLLLPEAYRGLEFVFLCIGFQFLIISINAVNNQILGFSKWYKLSLPLNLGLVLLTLASNYVFIVTLDMGVKGAALATLGTAIWNNAWRLIIVSRKMKTHPFSWPLVFISLIGFACASSFHWHANVFSHPLIGAAVQGILGSGTTILLCYISGFFPELREGIKARISWWP